MCASTREPEGVVPGSKRYKVYLFLQKWKRTYVQRVKSPPTVLNIKINLY